MKNDNINESTGAVENEINDNFYTILSPKDVSKLRNNHVISKDTIDGNNRNKTDGCFVVPKIMR